MRHLERIADGLITLALLAIIGAELYIGWALLWPVTTEDLIGLVAVLEVVFPWVIGIAVILLWAYALGWIREGEDA
jgi:hypothetical protein